MLLLISEEQSKVRVEFIFSNLKYVFLKLGLTKFVVLRIWELGLEVINC